MDPAIVGPASLAISQGINSFSQFLPKLSDVRRANINDNPDVAADVRMGEIAAVTLTVGVGAIVSSLTGSSAPAVVSVLVAGTLVCVYEATLRADRPMEPRTIKVAGIVREAS
jgi:flagellar basal body L-ring protein FlgH